MALVFKNTDQLWGAVIGQLSEEIQTKVAATAGKPYVHIRPKSKHLGVKDFKYCVEYASRSAEAYVKVESLNGGEKAKEAIQKFIDCHDEGNILDGVVPQQGAKNKNKWSWAVSSPATELNDELAKWYVETINAFWNFFETPVEGAPEIGADTEEEQFTLIEKMCDAFIVETDDEVYYVKLFAEQLRYVNGVLTGDGGSGDSRYGSTSGAFDQIGWGTMMFYRGE